VDYDKETNIALGMGVHYPFRLQRIVLGASTLSKLSGFNGPIS
jgi:hypothetical protein